MFCSSFCKTIKEKWFQNTFWVVSVTIFKKKWFQDFFWVVSVTIYLKKSDLNTFFRFFCNKKILIVLIKKNFDCIDKKRFLIVLIKKSIDCFLIVFWGFVAFFGHFFVTIDNSIILLFISCLFKRCETTNKQEITEFRIKFANSLMRNLTNLI